MVIRPGILEPVGKFFNGRGRGGSLAVGDDESCCCCGAGDEKKQTLHKGTLLNFKAVGCRQRVSGCRAVQTESRDRLEHMDKERFGRALGQGAREAAKALVKAADAAAAPDPKEFRARGQAVGAQVRHAAPQAAAAARRGVVEAKTTGAGIKRGSRRFGEAVWGPFVKLSGQLWLELTGVFFALFAVFAAADVWRRRGQFQNGGDPAHRAWFAVLMLAVFGYFSVSSFVRASRRGRRR
jgi:hypothetical protein